MRHLLPILGLALALPAQVVRAVNNSPVPFEGFVRAVCDPVPPHRIGVVEMPDGTLAPYFVGRQVGRDARAVDLKVSLPAGKRIEVDLAKSKAGDFERPPLPASDIFAWFGGDVKIGAQQFTLRSLDFDGAGYSAHMFARTGRMLAVDLWVHWIPTQPFASGEVLVTASNPSVPDMGEQIPADFVLQFGDALTVIPGLRAHTPIMGTNTYLADGQARALPCTFVWPRHVTTPEGWASFGAMAGGFVHALGVSRLLPQGNPMVPATLDPVVWANERRIESIRRLHTFEEPLCGPKPFSGITGSQEDQTVKRGEPMLPSGEHAAWIAYLGALKVAARPCHHREESGEPVDIDTHPQLAYWNGRPFFPHFPDALGKPRGISMSEAHGWSGPDVEHTIYSTLATACRLRDSSACQALLEAQAYVYLSQWHVDRARYPNHSVPYQSRATCWEGFMVQFCEINLSNRELARRVAERGRARVRQVIVPAYANAAGDVWNWIRDDRLGPGYRWMPWQQACGSYGLDAMSELLDVPEGRKVALKAARAVLRDAYWHDGQRWHVRDVVAADGAAVPSDGYFWFGSPMAVAVVLRHEPKDSQARSIWKQLMQEAVTVNDFAWLAPEVTATGDTK